MTDVIARNWAALAILLFFPLLGCEGNGVGLDRVQPKDDLPAGDEVRGSHEPGTVWAWGENRWGQLGDGTTEPRCEPVQVPGLTDVKAVAAGGDYSLALKSDGTVWAWGQNWYGQLGDGRSRVKRQLTPVQVRGLTEVKDVAAGWAHSLAVRSDGTVWAWGQNSSGALGDGTTKNRHTPVRVAGITGAVDVAADSEEVLSIVLDKDGGVWAWRAGYPFEFDDGTTFDPRVPTKVQGLPKACDIAMGFLGFLALGVDGSLWTWAHEVKLEQGHIITTDLAAFKGSISDWRKPVWLLTVPRAVQVADAETDVYVVKEDGTVWMRGPKLREPVRVQWLADIKAIVAGCTHWLALKRDGTVLAWGWVMDGGLGDGTNESRDRPVQVKGLEGVKAIAAGLGHSLAIKE